MPNYCLIFLICLPSLILLFALLYKSLQNLVGNKKGWDIGNYKVNNQFGSLTNNKNMNELLFKALVLKKCKCVKICHLN